MESKRSRQDYLREYRRAWMRERRRAFFADKSCVRCGRTEELELDHIVPEDKVTHHIWSWSQQRRDVELAKCQVLCYDCHLDKTVQARIDRRQHGTITMYDAGNCRCDECKAAKAVKRRKYTESVKQRKETA